MTFTATGRIKRILPIISINTKSNKVLRTRKFHIESNNGDFGTPGKPVLVEFTVTSYDVPINPNYATVDDLDQINVGRVVRFNFVIRPTFSINKKTGKEYCFTNLLVSSRFDVLEGMASYKARESQKYEEKQEAHHKLVETAIKDMASNPSSSHAASVPF